MLYYWDKAAQNPTTGDFTGNWVILPFGAGTGSWIVPAPGPATTPGIAKPGGMAPNTQFKVVLFDDVYGTGAGGIPKDTNTFWWK